MGMLSGGRNYDDMDRFYDPCDENRTEKQIVWEDGVYKQGGFRGKWAENFGRSDITKVGRKLATFFMAALLWNVVAEVIPTDGIIKMIFQCMSVTLTGFAEMWDLKGKNFTAFNWGYIVFLAVVSSAFYSFFNYLFGGWGYNAFVAAYEFLYDMTPAFGLAARVICSLTALFFVIKEENENKYTVISKVLFVFALVLGVVFRFMGDDSLYLIFSVIGVIFVILSFLLSLRSKNKFIRNMTFVFVWYSGIEILGYMGWMAESALAL